MMGWMFLFVIEWSSYPFLGRFWGRFDISVQGEVA
jgi:hypothetical protein